MKISIYSICKNESQFVDSFLDSVQPELQEGDNITICDTGSTDDTVELFKKRGIVPYEVVINPWRFDDARNASLSLVPKDIDVCICLDLDEQLQPGWRSALEDSWSSETTRLRYPYIWNWKEDGSPDIEYYAEKIHSRFGYRWKLPCHEVLTPTIKEVQTWSESVRVHHYADDTKSRSNYLGLMKLALEEDPTNDRMQHYYARELFFNGYMVEAVEWFQRHLDNPKATWRHERSQSMLYLARTGGNDLWIDMWLMRAAAECPERREVWFALADREREKGNELLHDEYTKRANSLPKDKYYLSSSR